MRRLERLVAVVDDRPPVELHVLGVGEVLDQAAAVADLVRGEPEVPPGEGRVDRGGGAVDRLAGPEGEEIVDALRVSRDPDVGEVVATEPEVHRVALGEIVGDLPRLPLVGVVHRPRAADDLHRVDRLVGEMDNDRIALDPRVFPPRRVLARTLGEPALRGDHDPVDVDAVVVQDHPLAPHPRTPARRRGRSVQLDDALVVPDGGRIARGARLALLEHHVADGDADVLIHEETHPFARHVALVGGIEVEGEDGAVVDDGRVVVAVEPGVPAGDRVVFDRVHEHDAPGGVGQPRVAVVAHAVRVHRPGGIGDDDVPDEDDDAQPAVVPGAVGGDVPAAILHPHVPVDGEDVLVAEVLAALSPHPHRAVDALDAVDEHDVAPFGEMLAAAAGDRRRLVIDLDAPLEQNDPFALLLGEADLAGGDLVERGIGGSGARARVRRRQSHGHEDRDRAGFSARHHVRCSSPSPLTPGRPPKGRRR